MTNATLTKPNPAKVAARTTGAPRVVAADSTAKQHAAARRAAEQLADALDSVKHAGDNVIVARYGADIDLSAVRLQHEVPRRRACRCARRVGRAH